MIRFCSEVVGISDARESTSRSATSTTMVTMAATSWLSVSEEMNIPTAISAAPKSRIPK